MNKTYKAISTILIVLFILALAFGGWLIFKQSDLLTSLKKSLPGLNQIGEINLPGGLLGPKTAKQAEYLDPNKIIEWTNFYRKENGSDEVTLNELLAKAAEKKADDMFEKQYFDHVSPIGVEPSQLVSSTGYNYRVTGENLAVGGFKDEKDLVDAWMASPGHRENILNPAYTEIGVSAKLGKYLDWGTTWMSVQEFGHPAPDCDKPDQSLLNDIDSEKNEYESLINEINSLNSQANEKIKQGNEIYKRTKDAEQAKPYWDEGSRLRDEAQRKEKEADALYNEIQTDSNKYNAQVNNYNNCIK